MIELPPWAVPNGADPYFIDAGGVLAGFTTDIRINRLGSKFGYAGTFPPHVYKDSGRILLNLLIQAQSAGLRMEVPLLGFKPGAPGSPVVNDNGQAGRTLALRGLTPNYAVRQGQWLTHMQGDEGFLYNVDAEVIANSSGEAVIALSPALREEPVDGDLIKLDRPTIQGFVVGDVRQWHLSIEQHIGLDFDLRERK